MAGVASADRARGFLYAVALATFLLSVYARVVPAWPAVFAGPGDVRLLDTDSYYHLRHTTFAVRHFPEVQRWDVGTNFPTGERSPHAGLFHVLAAAVCRLLGGQNASTELIATVLAWMPIGLYVASSLLLFLLARALAGAEVAAFVSALWSIFPGLSFARTLLGFADHHAAEIALTLATLWGLSAALSVPASSRLRRICYGLPLLAFQFTWSGAPLVIAVLAVGLLIAGWSDLLREGSCAPSARVAADWGGLLVLGLLGARALVPDAIMVERLFVPSVVLGLGLAVMGILAGRLAPVTQRQRLAVIAASLVIGAIVVGITLWRLPPEFVRQLTQAKSESVQEQRAVSALQFLALQGGQGAAGLLAVPLCWLAARRSAAFRAPLACAVVAAVVVAGWLLSHDYSYLPPPLLALSCGLAVAGSRVLWGARQTPWLLPGVLAVTASQIWPFLLVSSPFAAEPQRLLQIDRAWIEAMRWLREATPQPRPAVGDEVPGWPGGRFAYSSTSYGVLSAWDFGNLVSALGGRVPLSSLGFSRQIAEWLLTSDEATSLERLCPLCLEGQSVRYVVLSGPTLAEHFVTNWEQTTHANAERSSVLGLLQRSGASVPLVGYGPAYEQSIGVRLYAGHANGLQHYRLVYRSEESTWLSYQQQLGADGAAPFDVIRRSVLLEGEEARERAKALTATPLQPVELDGALHFGHVVTGSVMIFEVVRGARLRGKSWPGADLNLFLGLAARGQRLFVYRQSTRATATGDFEFVVPYPSGAGAALVKADAPMQILVTAPDGVSLGTFRIEVSEAEVRSGAALSLGDLTARE